MCSALPFEESPYNGSHASADLGVTASQIAQAARILGSLLARVEAGELSASRGVRARLEGAMAGLEAVAARGSRRRRSGRSSRATGAEEGSSSGSM